MQNKIKEIKENWGLYMQYIDEKPAITRTNLAFFEFSPIGNYIIIFKFYLSVIWVKFPFSKFYRLNFVI